MAAIAGIARAGQQDHVTSLLEKMAHRGRLGEQIISTGNSTIGMNWTKGQEELSSRLMKSGIVADMNGQFHYALAYNSNGDLILERGPIGLKPLYYGRAGGGELVFASEMKALVGLTRDIHLLPPGMQMSAKGIREIRQSESIEYSQESADEVAQQLFNLLDQSVRQSITTSTFGSWLSGGLDSSAIAALARPYVDQLYTFSAGLPGAPDLEYARIMADHLKSKHFEVIFDLKTMLEVLPQVIYYLESFDALLVRSSISNFLVGKLASDYVAESFSGEGADELFGGYEYLKQLDSEDLPAELADITGRLHNTALQRVDRCSAAHGLVVHVPLLDSPIVNFSRKIPPQLKIKDGVEKWILRKSVEGILPDAVLNRKKSKFWEGAGISELLFCYAEEQITDHDFQADRRLRNGWMLNTKEELLYYRIFKEHFGEFSDLEWMGRTKGSPQI